MAELNRDVVFYIIKAAGEQGLARYDEGIGGYPHGPGVSLFVAHNAVFETEVAALIEAGRLAHKTPGNRYMVVKQVGGVLVHEPRVDAYLNPAG